jgi:hypothetical protein
MTESPALKQGDAHTCEQFDEVCAERDALEARLVALERELNEQAAKHADCCVDRQERDEDRQAIRALETCSNYPEIAQWRKTYAAAIQRAQARP